LAALPQRFQLFGHDNRVNAIRLATQHVPHPVIFLLLCIPFGAATGYVTVTLVYLLSHAGVSVASVAGMIAISLLPQTWKVLWAPIVDTTLTSKRRYLIAALFAAATLVPIGFLPMTNAMLAAVTALVFTNSVATTFLAMATENLMARATGLEEKGRAGGWYQAGNLGGAGIGGGAALWLAQHSAIIWLPGAAMAGLCAACCIAL
jgi:MFS transporter, PAT family, beta-lactamase induction signal transducer AmpG